MRRLGCQRYSSRERARVSAWRRQSHWAGPDTPSVATMRNLDRGGALREVVEKERLPISILKMDVDSDESVDAATAAIRAQTGSIDVLVNNAGIERTGSIEGLGVRRLQSRRWKRITLAPFARFVPGSRTCAQGGIGCIVNVTSVAGTDRVLSAGAVQRIEIRAWRRSAKRSPRRSNAIQCARRDCSTRDHRHRHGPAHRGRACRRRLPAGPPLRPHVRGVARAANEPTVVAEKIREIIESGTDKLRHPVGPDAEPFLGWRASLNDEEWVKWGALSDDEWYERVANDFGLDVHSKRRPVAGEPATTRTLTCGIDDRDSRWQLPPSLAHRSGRDGRGLSRARHKAWARRRGQGVAVILRERSRSAWRDSDGRRGCWQP